MRARACIGLAGAVVGLGAGHARASDDALPRAEAAWAARSSVLVEERAAPETADRALAAYRQALDATPDSVAIRWRLMRAQFFRSDFTTLPPEEKAQAIRDGRAIGQETVALLTERTGGRPLHERREGAEARIARAELANADVARAYFWAAILEASWAREAGLLAAVRAGVAGKMRDYAELSAQLEPGYYRGGALRLLARLHGTLPRVPLISGWVDRDRAVPLARRALAIQPDDSGNQLLLAMTLLELEPDATAETRALLAGAAAAPIRPELVAEDLAVRRSAEEKLAALEPPQEVRSAE